MRPLLFLIALTASAVELKPISPAGVKPVGPYSPGIFAGDYLYISGQGGRDTAGKLPATFEAQSRQCLDNVKAVLEAAGLNMFHVVHVQVYLTEMKNYDALNRIFTEYFPKDAPARSTIGVARMPTETPVEITAVAVRDTKMRKVIALPNVPTGPASLGVQVGDRLYMSGLWGRSPEGRTVPADPKSQVQYLVQRAQEVLKRVGLEMRNLVYANVYVDRAMPMELLADVLQEVLPDETAVTVIQTDALPAGASIEISGVASKNLQRYGACTGLGETLYCQGRGGRVDEILAALKVDLDAAKSNMSKVVATNVYIDDIDNFAVMNKTYGTAFGPVPPTRTTVQPLPKRAGRPNQISLIAFQ